MTAAWTTFDIIYVGSILLGLGAGSVHLVGYYRQHRHEPGIRGHLVFNIALWSSLVIALPWPERSKLRDVVMLICMVTALGGLCLSWWEKRRRRSEPPAVVT